MSKANKHMGVALLLLIAVVATGGCKPKETTQGPATIERSSVSASSKNIVPAQEYATDVAPEPAPPAEPAPVMAQPAEPAPMIPQPAEPAPMIAQPFAPAPAGQPEAAPINPILPAEPFRPAPPVSPMVAQPDYPADGQVAAPPSARPIPPASMAPDVVGRVYFAGGDLLRYVPETRDWVAVIRDAPFGGGDTLYAGNKGMAELIIPNGAWVRTGHNTQIQFLAMKADLTEVDLGSGVARFYNKSDRNMIKASTDFGYVLADSGDVFDYYVGENSAEIVPVRGRLAFVHAGTGARYDVEAGAPSLLVDRRQVAAGEAAVDASWDQWNASRETFWADRTRPQIQGPSATYLPAPIRHESYVFEENGRWERVNYEGHERILWRPVRVQAGWAPYTVGRWTEWEGDQTWIPAEPFGYVTHHYGNWVQCGGRWYWAPPSVAVAHVSAPGVGIQVNVPGVNVTVGLPEIGIGFAFCPGRVSWIHTGANIGWVPLAPHEEYYSHRNWHGHHNNVMTNANINIRINIGALAYVNHAYVVPQERFYGEDNYARKPQVVVNNTTIINNYHAAPVVNNTVINNITINNNRYNYTNVVVKEKPHSVAASRIQQNAKIMQKDKQENATIVRQQVSAIKPGKVSIAAKIEAPKITNVIVPASEVNKPKTEVKLPQQAIIGKTSKPVTAPVPNIVVHSAAPQPTAKPGAGTIKPPQVEPSVRPTPAIEPGPAIHPTPATVKPTPVKPEPLKPSIGEPPSRPTPATVKPTPVKPEPLKPSIGEPPSRPTPATVKPTPMKPEPLKPSISEPPSRPTPATVKPTPVKPEPLRPSIGEPPSRPTPATVKPTPATVKPEPLRPSIGEPPSRPTPPTVKPTPVKPEPLRPSIGEPPSRPTPATVKPTPVRPEPLKPSIGEPPSRPTPATVKPTSVRPEPLRPSVGEPPSRPTPAIVKPETVKPSVIEPPVRPTPPAARPERVRPSIEPPAKPEAVRPSTGDQPGKVKPEAVRPPTPPQPGTDGEKPRTPKTPTPKTGAPEPAVKTPASTPATGAATDKTTKGKTSKADPSTAKPGAKTLDPEAADKTAK